VTTLQRYLVAGSLIVLVPGAAAVAYWYYWPIHMLHEAESDFAAGEYELAENKLKVLVRKEPDNYQAHYLRARALRQLKRPAEAEAVLREAVDHGLEQALGRREFALAEVLKGFTPNAERNLLSVFKENPDDPEVLQALALGYGETQRLEEADQMFARWLAVEPGRVDALLARGQAHLVAGGTLYSGRDVAKAEADFEEILRQQPDHFEAHLRLAHCFLSDARLAEAKEQLLMCRRLAEDRIEPLVGLATCAMEERNYPEAEKLIRQAAAIDPKSTYVLMMHGDLELRRERFDRAVPVFQRLLDLDPESRGGHLKLAQALRRLGKTAEADEHEKLFQELELERQSRQR
jgi:predicted Zn-dependent protease